MTHQPDCRGMHRRLLRQKHYRIKKWCFRASDDPRRRQLERETRGADHMRRAVFHVYWLQHLNSFIDGLKANSLTVSEVTWERFTEE